MKTDKKRLVIKRRHELKGGIFPCNGVAHMPTCTMIMINGGTDKHEAIQLQIGRERSHKKLVPDRRKLLVGENWKRWILLTKIRNNITPSKIKQLISSKFQSRSSLIVTETDQNLGYKENKRIRSFNLKADKTSKIAYRYMNLWQHHIIRESNLLHACKNFLCTARRSCWNYL